MTRTDVQWVQLMNGCAARTRAACGVSGVRGSVDDAGCSKMRLSSVLRIRPTLVMIGMIADGCANLGRAGLHPPLVLVIRHSPHLNPPITPKS